MRITSTFIVCGAVFMLFAATAEAARTKKKSSGTPPDVVIENWNLSRTRKPPVVRTRFTLANHDRYMFENSAVQMVFLDRLGNPIRNPKRPSSIGRLGPGGEREIKLSAINMPVFAGLNVIVTGTFKKRKIAMRFFASSPFSPPVFLSEKPSGNAARLFLIGQRFKRQGKTDVGHLNLRILNNGLADAKGVSVVVKFYNAKGSLLHAMEEPIDHATATVPSGEEKSFIVFMRRVPLFQRISVALKYQGAPSEKSLSGEVFSGEPIVEIGEVYLKRLNRDHPNQLTLQGKVRNGTDEIVENVKVDWSFTVLEGKKPFTLPVPAARPTAKSSGRSTAKKDRLKGVRYLLGKKKKKVSPNKQTEPRYVLNDRDISFTIPGTPLKPGDVRRFRMEVADIFEIQMFQYNLSYGSFTESSETSARQDGSFTIEGLDDFTAGGVTVSGLKLVRAADGAVTLSVNVTNKGAKNLKNIVYAVDCLSGTENNPQKVHTLRVKIPVLKAGATTTGTVKAAAVPGFENISYTIKWGT